MKGKVAKFEMNDRCAAGTGKFFEIMAKTLGYKLDEFGPKALEAHKDFETDAFRIIEDKGVQKNPSGQKVWKARIALSAPCSLCGGMHTYNAEDLPCPFTNPANQDGLHGKSTNCDNGDKDP